MPTEPNLTGIANQVCLNGELVEKHQARVSPFDRGYLFADGVYEGVGFATGRMLDNPGHFARLNDSLKALGIANPWSDQQIAAMQQALLKANECDEGFCYYQITRGEANRDFAFPEQTHARLLMFLQPRPLLETREAEQGVQVGCVPEQRWKARSIKSIALLPQVLAKQQARDAGWFEGWMVENGEVNEGSSTSAFIINQAGEVQTAPLSERILPGVTRRAVLELAGEQGFAIREAHFTPEQAHQAREAFLTSASQLVTPIVGVDNQPIANGKPGEITGLLRRLYIERYLSGKS